MLVVFSGSAYVPEGLGRTPLANPNAFASYGPGSYWADEFYAGARSMGRPLVPMDARTTASATGPGEYEFDNHAGVSWAVPYQAGLYALAAQVDPTITPARFLSLERQTGRTVEVERDGRRVPLGPIVDPQALIGALKATAG